MKILNLIYLAICAALAHLLFAVYYIVVVTICAIKRKKYNRCHTDYLILGIKDTKDDVQEAWRVLWH